MAGQLSKFERYSDILHFVAMHMDPGAVNTRVLITRCDACMKHTG